MKLQTKQHLMALFLVWLVSIPAMAILLFIVESITGEHGFWQDLSVMSLASVGVAYCFFKVVLGFNK